MATTYAVNKEKVKRVTGMHNVQNFEQEARESNIVGGQSLFQTSLVEFLPDMFFQ